MVPQLNEEQSIAFKTIVSYLKNESTDKYVVLEGYAGTGKTFTIARIIEHMLQEFIVGYNIAMTAPTNKAVRVLNQAFPIKNEQVSFSTIHKLLGLKMQITDKGEQIFTPELFNDNPISNINCLIVDETSMLDDRLFQEIVKQPDLKVIFLGDPAQIPPVNREDSIPFKPLLRDEYGIKCVRLTEIMRQTKGNPIIEASFLIRNNISKRILSQQIFETNLIDEFSGVISYKASKKEDKLLMIQDITNLFTSEDFKKDANHAKVLAWRNETVNSYNNNIRRKIFEMNVVPKIILGEKLIANSPIVETNPHGYVDIVFNTNDEFVVEELEVSEHKGYKCYEAIVPIVDSDKKKTIYILHEESEPKMRNFLRKLESEAKMLYHIDRAKSQMKWRYYYAVKQWFSDVAYNYAITIHKAQGSTYSNSVVLADDILRSHNVIERNRILYTACTRPKNKLILLS